MLGFMRSVADEVRRQRQAALCALADAQRVDLALRLGDEDLAAYCAAERLDPGTARQRLRARRQLGRRPSRCAGGEGSP
jgi:hypothetical protein